MEDIFGFEAKSKETRLKEELAVRIARWKKLKRWVNEMAPTYSSVEILAKMNELEGK